MNTFSTSFVPFREPAAAVQIAGNPLLEFSSKCSMVGLLHILLQYARSPIRQSAEMERCFPMARPARNHCWGINTGFSVF